jgi:predicted ester cyclase
MMTMGTVLEAFPDLSIQMTHLLADGDKVAPTSQSPPRGEFLAGSWWT